MTNILRTYLKVCLLLSPIFFLPVVVDSYGFGKNWFMFLMMLVGVVIWIVSLIVKKDNKIVVSKSWGWLLTLTVWAGAFWFFGEAGVKMRTFMGTPGLGMLLSMMMWTFLWMQVNEQRDESEYKWLTIAGLITAVSSLAVFLIPAAKMPISWPKANPLISISGDWSLTGSILGELWLLAILGIVWIKKLLAKIKNREGYIGEMVLTAVLVLVLFLDVFKTMRAGWNYLDVNSSWTIASESLKRRPLQGVGVGNFLEAFKWWRPASFNSDKNWTGTFGWSANGGLQLWTELGIGGLLLGVLMGMSFLKEQKSKSRRTMVFLLAIALILSPVNLLALVLAVWLVTREIETKEVKLMLKVGESGMNAAPIILSVLLLIGVGIGGYWWTRVLLGEIYLKNSLVAAASNDGGGTYTWQIKAITANANNAEYRRIYSQTNLVLATGLMSNKEITDEQKQNAAVLIQQAVREGKAAVALDSGNSSYWSNLAAIYRQLVGSVDGSADWSYQAYAQAANLDPTDPLLRLDFGGLLFAAGNYEEAGRIFEQVVTLKPDLANGWYNLAYAEKKLGKLELAVNHLNQAVTLVPVTSGDYDMATKELATWKKEYEDLMKKQADSTKAATKQAETLKVPQALPTGTNPSVVVPVEGLAPPTGQPIPTPTVAETP